MNLEGFGLLRALIFSVLLLVVACGPRTTPFETAPRPDVPGFLASVPAGHTTWSNSSLADLFVLLTHGLESGRSRKNLQRFETAVNVGMIGEAAPRYRKFLGELLAEIRNRSEVDIHEGTPPHNLLIRFIPGEEFLPHTSNQCVILFGQPTWPEFLLDTNAYSGLVTQKQDHQEKMSIFIPDTIEPFKVRECLLEEITQALGTANDLFGLATTISNDDNAHSWPTAIDYLMLKALYDPRLSSGLSKAETRKQVLPILQEINPQGRSAPDLPTIRQKDFKDWRLTLFSMFDDDLTDERRLELGRQVYHEAESKAPDSAYECMGASTYAHAAGLADDPEAPILHARAIEICTRVHGADDIRIAVLRLDRSLDNLNEDRYRMAKDEAEAVLPALLSHGLEDQVALSWLIQAVAALELGDPHWESDYLEVALAWAAYAFGDDNRLTEKLRR